MFEKLNIDLPEIENIEFKFEGQKIFVFPFFTVGGRARLINQYIEHLFGDSNEDIASRYVVAEHGLIIQIIEEYTNINTDSIDWDVLIACGLWDRIKILIKYDEFKKELDDAVRIAQFEKSLEKSVGNVIENLSDRLIFLLNKLSEMDVDTLKSVSEEFVLKLNELNTNIPGITGNVTSGGRKKKESKDVGQS